MSDILLDVQHLTHCFPLPGRQTLRAVNDVSFQLKQGEILGLVGESGCGKSTVARCIMNVYRPTAGHIYYDGIDTCDAAQYRANRRRLEAERQLIFQDSTSSLNPRMTAAEIIAEPMAIHHMKPPRGSLRAEAAFQLYYVGMEESYLDKYPPELSGGQRQRVAIGRAIVRDPAVFLMDEPLSNLDAKLRNQMRAEIIKLRQRINTTFIYVTHDQTEAMTLGDRIVIMKDGFIQQIGTPQEVFDHPANLFVAGFIGTPQMNFFDAKLVKNSDGKYAVAIDGINVELAEDKQARLSAKNVPEQDVTLGVRPDHIMLCADGVKGTVDVSELMGSSVHLHISTHGHDVVVIVPTNGNAAHFPMGSEVNMIFGGNVAHVFSKETEKNLEW
mgnify:CR=1 FL=1